MNSIQMREPQHRVDVRALSDRRGAALLAAMLMASAGLVSLRGVDADPVLPPPADPSTSHRVMPEQLRLAILEAERQSAAALRPDPSVPEAIEERWGVQVIRLDYTAEGYWLGFRFRVTDVDKALPLFDSRLKPYVESEKTGLKLGVPTAAKVGALRTTNRGGNIKAGKIYNIMFSNPGAIVKPGDVISLVIGDFKIDRLTVQ